MLTNSSRNVRLQARAAGGASFYKPLFGANPIPRSPRMSVFGQKRSSKGEHHHLLVFNAILLLG
jgi:hypothetical protein